MHFLVFLRATGQLKVIVILYCTRKLYDLIKISLPISKSIVEIYFLFYFSVSYIILVLFILFYSLFNYSIPYFNLIFFLIPILVFLLLF